jgi:hypothetical protein
MLRALPVSRASTRREGGSHEDERGRYGFSGIWPPCRPRHSARSAGRTVLRSSGTRPHRSSYPERSHRLRRPKRSKRPGSRSARTDYVTPERRRRKLSHRVRSNSCFMIYLSRPPAEMSSSGGRAPGSGKPPRASRQLGFDQNFARQPCPTGSDLPSRPQRYSDRGTRLMMPSMSPWVRPSDQVT